jgi:hypothetical protein
VRTAAVQSDPDEALDVLYRLRESWTRRSDGHAQTIVEAIESLIADYEAARGAREEV